MIKNRLAITLIGTCILSTIAAFSATAAWFLNASTVELNDTKGYTESSYFAGGDGSSEHPFIITNKVHMYNLAWLQYLGRFNQIDEDTGLVEQKYFRVGFDEGTPITVDMTGLALPPIGTEQYPFLGSFDGNGSTIDKAVITNKIDEDNITKKPLRVTELNDVKIIGLFGVVGSINPTYEGKYSSEVLNVTDLYIRNAEVRTFSTESLIGVAAGYVNGKIDGVGVVNSSVNVAVNSSAYSALDKTNNISDYTLIGYCEDEYKTSTVKATTSIGNRIGRKETFVIEDDGDISGWGGSIDMKSMHARIVSKLNSASTPGNFIYSKSVINDGALPDEDIVQQASGYRSNGTRSFTYKYTSSDDGGSYYVGTASSNSFLYLYQETMNVTHYTREDVPGQIIASGSNYLRINNGNSVVNETNQSNATVFVYQSNALSFAYGHEKRYLNGSTNGTLSASTNSSTNWQFDSSKQTYYITSGSTRYYLQYDNGWKLKNETTTRYYKISSGTNYLSNSGTTIANSNEDSATLWTISNGGTNPSGTISTQINGTKYYVRYNNGLSISTTSSSWTNDGNKLYVRTGSRWQGYVYNYLKPDGGSWTTTTDSDDASTTLTFTPVDVTDYAEPLTFIDANSYKDTDKGTTVENSSYPTCFPLNVDKNSYNVTDSNTGYVISGGYSAKSSSGRGDIRVSKYSISDNIGNSYSNNSFNTVYTIDIDGTKQTIDSNHSFEKYDNAKSKMLGVLQGQSDVYGLHFMDAAITMKHMVTAPKAVINGATYYDYQFPNDCIDFNLKEQGHINFFAGTYYSGNSSFFSIHKIYRDSNNNIVSINEIKKIYRSTTPGEEYLYLFKDGTYSTGETTFPSGYEENPIFDTDVLTNPGSALSSDYVYYFEVPCDAGEYALGSVSGNDGAYLMYLDISANAKEIARTEMFDSIENTFGQASYPLGVASVAGSGDPVDSEDSAFVALSSSFRSTQTIARNDATSITITKTDNSSLVYRHDKIIVKDGSNNVVTEIAPIVTTKETSRVLYADVNTATRETTYFYAIKETDGTSTSYRYEAYQLLDDGSLADITDSFTLYDWDGKTKSLGDAVLAAFGFEDLSTINNTILTYAYECTAVDEYTFEYKIKLSELDPSTEDYFFSLIGYDIDCSNEDGEELTVKVTKKGTGLTFTYSGMEEGTN